MRRAPTHRSHNLLDPLQPAPFLKKTYFLIHLLPPHFMSSYDLVNDPETDKVISWGPDEQSFVVWEPAEFARNLLPLHFKHNNFSSFVRQLNTYGFRKIDPDRWEFSNDNFLKGFPDSLIHIQRRKPTPNPSSNVGTDNTPHVPNANSAIEIGLFGGLKDEVENLKRDRNVLMLELVRLRQHQQWSENEIRRLQERIERGENRQSELLHLFTQYLQNPSILTSFLKHANRSRLDDHPRSRRKRRAQRSPGNSPTSSPMKERKLISYQRPEPAPYSSHEFTERLDRLLGSFQEEANGASTLSNGIDDYFQTHPPALTHSTKPLDLDLVNETVVGMPVIPDNVSAGEFLAGLDLEGLQQPPGEIQTHQDIFDGPNGVQFDHQLTVPETQGGGLEHEGLSFENGDIDEELTPQFPFLDAEEMLGFSDRSVSDEYWRKFLTTTTQES